MGQVFKVPESEKVLIVTRGATVAGSMIKANNSILSALGRQYGIMRESSAIWLDVALKAVSAELLGARTLFYMRPKFKRSKYRKTVE